MKISVAIAAYRGEKYIGDQLVSIVNQTVVPDEVVICDDSPDDLTENEVRKFEKFLNIRYFRNSAQLGAAANFNKALSLCSGNVVFLADQDDVWYPYKVAWMMERFSAGAQAVFCDSDITDANGEKMGFTHFESRGYVGLRKYAPGVWKSQFSDSCCRFPAAGHDMALKNDLLKKLLPIPELANCHDNYLGVAAAAFDAWEIVPDSCGTFRRHGNNSSGAGAKLSFLGQLKTARASVKNNSFAWNAELFRSIIEKLPDLPRERIALLKERMEHSLARAQMGEKKSKKLRLIIQEIRNRNYFRFGRGWKNVIQDLFLR
ncbi:MAG: glycosyltransferase [Lentisphaeria bacterium]|nr:glycosyltransferase [Lentisphaeria bacterium]